MNKSQSIANLAAALAKAQAEMPKVKFDAKNPFLKNKYASLGAVIETAKPVLAKFALAVSQFPVSQVNMVGVTTLLMHESGEYLEDTIFVLPEVAKGLSINQSAGVSITYLRRYAYASILGLYADEDVDGDAHNGDTVGNESANSAVEAVFKGRNWGTKQTEAISMIALDYGAPLTREEAVDILNLSTLPENVSEKTIQSWFKHYLASEGENPMLKAADANEAYSKAKKSGGK